MIGSTEKGCGSFHVVIKYSGVKKQERGAALRFITIS